MGWRLRNEEFSGPTPLSELTRGQRFRREQGIDIGIRARELFQDGVLIDEPTTELAATKTESVLNDRNVPAIFEAAFLLNGYATRSDVLRRRADQWDLFEVKSGVNDHKDYVDDLAYTAMVLSKCGIKIASAKLLLISREFRLGMDNPRLFNEIDHSDDILARLSEFDAKWETVDEATKNPIMPEPHPVWACRNCSFLKECVGNGIENPIFDIPRLSEKKFNDLVDSDILSIEAIPLSFALTENQDIVRAAVQTGNPVINDNLSSELHDLSWPVHYLDFETAVTAIPLYEEIAPYTQVPTQYSVHQSDRVGNISNHTEYLADPTKDSRFELAVNLINDLSGDGSIIVYSHFEKTIIIDLAKLYPQLGEQLSDLIERLVDMQTIMSKNYYHPAFKGSMSLKDILPVLVPELSYENLTIPDGGTALATFVYLATGRYQGEEADAEKQNLLDYCKQDTLALVKIHEQLSQLG